MFYPLHYLKTTKDEGRIPKHISKHFEVGLQIKYSEMNFVERDYLYRPTQQENRKSKTIFHVKFIFRTTKTYSELNYKFIRNRELLRPR